MFSQFIYIFPIGCHLPLLTVVFSLMYLYIWFYLYLFFSPLWLLNFELLLKLLFPLQSYKRNYSIFSPVIFMAFFFFLHLSLIHLEFNLWLNFISTLLFIPATYYTTYLPIDLICHLYHTLSSYICIFGFISELYVLLTSLFIHLQHTFNCWDETWTLLSLKTNIPSLLFFRLFLTKIFPCFFESEFLLEINFYLVPEKRILLELHTVL